MTSMTTATDKKELLRNMLLERIDSWVEELMADNPEMELLSEDLPDNIREPDLFSLCSAVTALTEEFRLQTRGYRKLLEDIGSLSGRIDNLSAAGRPAQTAAEATIADDCNVRERYREEAQVELVEHFVEVHDRLFQTTLQIRQRLEAYGILRRLTGDKAVMEALLQGLDFTMQRFDAALAAAGMRRFGLCGDAFDPSTMRAVLVSTAVGGDSGKVTSVLRSGYYRYNQIWRYADVEVSK